MSAGTEPLDPQRLARQCLDSLRAAGVEWLPKGMPEGISFSPITEGATMPKSKSANPANPVVQVTPAGEPGSVDHRRVELQVLAKTVSTCTRCPELASTRTQTVFGVGQPGVELCFVGEAPGADEDKQGEPFVGAAGQLLNKIIVACGLQREEVYICNTIKCRPPGNRTPLPNEMGNCREYFDHQLELVQPKFICAPGRLRRAEPAQHHGSPRQAARPVPRLQGDPGDRDLSPRLPAATPRSAHEEGSVGGHEDVAGPHGSAGAREAR